ncbi:MAG: amidohydrolase family protein, partial [Sphaerochaetaceae bacterium]|nr:amidohydrolase family protein [Sphaerochaetaceae bacterium]
DVFKKAFAQGFICDAISTDIHERSLPVVQSLSLTMTKVLSCGMNLMDIISKVTFESATMLNINHYSDIKEGTKANITIFEVNEEKVELKDSGGEMITGNQIIKPYGAISGNLYYLSSINEIIGSNK